MSVIFGTTSDLFNKLRIFSFSDIYSLPLFSGKYPKKFTESEAHDSFPDGKPCIFYYDEDTKTCIVSHVEIFYDSKKDELQIDFIIALRWLMGNGKFRDTSYLIYPPGASKPTIIPNDEFENHMKEFKITSAKVKSVMKQAAKYFPDVAKVRKFLDSVSY